jgi:hypothetical protein
LWSKNRSFGRGGFGENLRKRRMHSERFATVFKVLPRRGNLWVDGERY